MKASVTVHASPDDAWKRVVAVGQWWSSEHTYSGDARNMSLEPKAGGCWCENVTGGGTVKHLEILYAQPSKTLVMSGGLGPLLTMAVSARLVISIEKQGEGSRVGMMYTVGGYHPGGLDSLAAPVDGVLTQQLTRLQNLIERGDASKAAQ